MENRNYQYFQVYHFYLTPFRDGLLITKILSGPFQRSLKVDFKVDIPREMINLKKYIHLIIF